MSTTYPRSSRRSSRSFSGRRPRHYSNSRPVRRTVVIDPAKFINSAVVADDAQPYRHQHEFADFGFDRRLMAAIEQKGYSSPTPIQDQAIASIQAGRDVVGQAMTGTGKTAAFLLPIVDRLLRDRHNLALIVVPTRELAAQINDEFKSFAARLNLFSAVCVGGVKINKQIAALSRHPQVIIATPGRLKDLLQNHKMPIGQCRTVVLDEVDRMLDMGFVRDIKYFIAQLPVQHQSLCFSATVTPPIRDIIDSIAHDPITIVVPSRDTSDQVEQNVIRANTSEEKLGLLLELLKDEQMRKVLVFGDTKHSVQRLSDKLAKAGIKTATIHGNKSQPQRQRALTELKNSTIQVLVATDVAARGLDIPAVTHVINFDTPQTYEDYIHRIGRTGRAGLPGNALTFIPR